MEWKISLTVSIPVSLFYADDCSRTPHRDQRLELSVWTGYLEWHLLSAVPRPLQELRRARLLRRTFRYRRSELDLLRRTTSRRVPRVGTADARAFRVLVEALSEVHPSEDVQTAVREPRSSGFSGGRPPR